MSVRFAPLVPCVCKDTLVEPGELCRACRQNLTPEERPKRERSMKRGATSRSRDTTPDPQSQADPLRRQGIGS